MKMRENVKSKMAKYPETLLEVTSSENYHKWFDLMIYPRYVNELTDVRKMYEI